MSSDKTKKETSDHHSHNDHTHADHSLDEIDSLINHDHGDHSTLGKVFGFITHRHEQVSIAESLIDTSNQGIKALQISFIALAVTAIVQIAVVLFSGSIALMSDSLHNLADALTAIPLGVAFWIGKRKANNRYTYGYGRAEDIAGIFIVLLIASSSFLVLYESINRLLHPQNIFDIPLVIAAGVIGFIGNEFVALYRIRIGKKIGSAALMADGLHARSDGLASLAVVVGALGVNFGLKQADPIASLFIGIAVFAVLRDAVRQIYRRLMDSVDPNLVAKVEKVLISTPGIEEVGKVRIRWVGHELRTEIEVLSNPDLSLIESHRIAENAHHNLLHEIPRLSEAIIHTSPKFEQIDLAHKDIAHHFTEDK